MFNIKRYLLTNIVLTNVVLTNVVLTKVVLTSIVLFCVALITNNAFAAPPVAVNDTRQRTDGFDLVINALDNDSDPDGDSLTVTFVGSPSATISSDKRSIEYKPQANFTGNDQFSYTITDSNGDTATATISIIFRELQLPEFATNNNQRTIAAALDAFCRELQRTESSLNTTQLSILARCEALFQLAANGDTGLISDVLQQIAPEEIAAQVDTTLGFIKGQGRNIEQRLNEIKSNGPKVSGDGLSFTLDGQTISGSMISNLLGLNSQGGSAGDDVVNDPFEKLGLFINGNIENGDHDATSNESAYEWEASGVTLGADYRITAKTIVGLAYGFSNNEVDFSNNGGITETDSSTLMAFGTYYYQQFYSDVYFGYGWGQFTGFRNIIYNEGADANSIFSAAARGDTDHGQTFFNFSSSMDINKGPFTFSPYTGVEYVKTNIDGYSETNANGWEVKFGDRAATSLRTSLGSRASFVINGKSYVLIPQGRLAWIHEFEDSSRTVTGQFVNDPLNSEFDITIDEEDSDFMQFAVGASIVYTGGFSGFFEYETNFGLENFSEHHYNFGIRWEAAY